jgi:hypothetical protein
MVSSLPVHGMTRLFRASSRDHGILKLDSPPLMILLDSIITMLSHAMTEEEQNKHDETENDLKDSKDEDISDDEFDEAPSLPPMARTRSNPPSKVDFCCLHDTVIRCVCANIIAHIQISENSHYVPPTEYDLFNKEGGSLVHSFLSLSLTWLGLRFRHRVLYLLNGPSRKSNGIRMHCDCVDLSGANSTSYKQ